MKVQFLRTTDQGIQQPAGTAYWNGRQIILQGLSRLMRFHLERHGIRIGSEILFLSDGLAFLDGLPRAFSGSRMRAEVKTPEQLPENGV